MKEAAGEANMTVITIVLIAIVLGVGTLIVSNLMNGTNQSSACNSAGGTWYSGKCYPSSTCSYGDNGKVTGCTGTPMTCSKQTGGEYLCK